MSVPPASLRFAPAVLVLALLAGCASTRPTEVRDSPAMPPAPASLPAPPPALPALPAPVPGPESAPVEERPQRPAPELPSLPMPPAPAAPSIERHLPAGTRDRAGWAQDMAVAFAALRLPASPQNICSVVAITEQESLFVEDPPVPGLARIVWKEIEQRRQRFGIPRMLLDAALLKSSPNGQSYRRRIDALRTEKQMNALYQDMISELPYGRTLLAERNPVRTGGPMQVSIAFAEAHARQHPYPYARRGSIRWDPLESTCRHASLSIL